MSSPERMVPGAVLGGRYVIDRLVSEGGMGAIYRATDAQDDRPVAVKLILAPQGTTDERERFEREARVLRELSHPSIVSYIAHGRAAGGSPYLVMEWLEGEDLGARLGRGPLGVEESVRLLRRLCAGLMLAHGRGILHRDLKPANVFLVEGRLDQAKLIDFGVARRLERSLALTRPGLLVGTLEYMAPEQARGAAELSCAADVFALGCLLYECLSGRQAFSGDRIVTVLCRVLFEEPASLREAPQPVPQALRELVERTPRKDPAARPADAAALAQALESLGPLDGGAGPVDPAAPTLAPARPPTPDLELLSIVLGRAEERAEGALATLSPEEADELGALIKLLSQLGAKVHQLVDGTFLMTAPRSASARDQVALAVRAALLLRERWPDARVAVLTGRGVRQGTLPVGDVVEAGLRLLERDPALGHGAVILDELSAQLAPPRFRLEAGDGCAYLLGEDVDADETRPLLGRPTPCLGREVELSGLLTLLRTCAEDREPQAILVTGAAGQGKSRLRHELLRRIAQSDEALTVIAGRGEPAATPYAVLRQALRRHCQLPAADPDAARRLLLARLAAVEEAAARQQAPFLAELLGLPPSQADSPPRDAARRDPLLMREQLRRAFTALLRAECRRAPLLLVLDDLQWCDAGTVDLVDQALSELRAEPLCVLALGRPEVDAAHPGLWQGHGLRRMALGRLGKRACERLSRQALEGARPEVLSDEVIGRIVAQADGNPLLLEELIRAAGDPAAEGLPRTVLAMLQARMGVLSPVERHALRIASVLGPGLGARDVAALGGDGACAEALDRLCDAELLCRAPEREAGDASEEFVFRNDLVREAAYDLIPPAERAALHRQVARYAEAAHPSAPLRIATHWLEAAEAAAAVPWLTRAAEQALRAHDLAGTQRIAGQALAAGASGAARAELQALQAAAAFWQSDYQACRDLSLAALPELPGGPARQRLLADGLIASARIGDRATAARLHGEALQGAPGPDQDEGLICLARIGFHWLAHLELARADEVLARLGELAPPGAPRAALVRAQLAHVAGMRAALRGELAEYAERLEEVVAAFEEAGDLRNAAVETTTLAISLLQVGQVAEAEALARRNLQRCEGLGAHQATGYARLSLGLILVRGDGPLPEARALLTAALAQYEAVDHRRRIGLCHGYLALLALREGRPEDAADSAARAVDHLVGAGGFHTWALALHADALLGAGRTGDAAPLAGRAHAELERAGGSPIFDLLPCAVQGELLCRLGRPDEARDVVLSALGRLRGRCLRITRPAWRASYLGQPEQQRILRLAGHLCPQALSEAQLTGT